MLACALAAEERVARRAGARAARVGLGARLPLPPGALVSFGVCGALVPTLEAGDLVTAAKVVSEDGTVLWEGEPLPVPGARPAVVCAVATVVDDPRERAALAARSGADVADLESGALAASGRLAGVVRAVSDTPARPVGRLGRAASPDGAVDAAALATAFLREPRRAARAALQGRRALRSLASAAAELAQGPGGSPGGAVPETGEVRGAGPGGR